MCFCYRLVVTLFIDLFVSFNMSNSVGTASMKQRSHIKSCSIWNLGYSRHLRIINYVDLEWILAINLNIDFCVKM